MRSSAVDYKTLYYPEARFGGFTDIDGTMAFYARVNALAGLDSVVLDVGCGRGAYAEDSVGIRRNLRILKGKCRKVIGIDILAEHGVQNAFVDEFRQIEGNRWPAPDKSIDLVLCDNVLEHVEEPSEFFAELRRVTRSGGYVCIRTPNVLSYFGVLSSLVPRRFHGEVVRRLQKARGGEDVFPTRYRCNTRWKLRRMLSKYGFAHHVYGYEAEPSYLNFSRFAYLFGVLHQRFAPNAFKVALFAFGQKLEAV